MKKLTFLQQFLWLLPFASFLLGYQLVGVLFGPSRTLQTPNLIGLPLHEAFTLLSANNLNPRLLATKQMLDVPAGTVMHQTPLPKTKIKPYQTIFLVIATQPQQHGAPQLVGSATSQVETALQKMDIQNKSYFLASPFPKDTCIAQSPEPGVRIPNKTMITYISAPTPLPVVMPNFAGKPIAQVLEFLRTHNLAATVTHREPQDPQHQCNDQCIVTDQRPLAGSFVTLDAQKPLHIQLAVG